MLGQQQGKRVQPASKRIGILLSFGAFGLIYSAWQAALPDFQSAAHLTSQRLGLVVTLGFSTAIPLMSSGGRVVNRFGANRVIAVSLLLMSAALVSISAVREFPALVVCSIVFFGATGMLDIAINAAAITWEQLSLAPLLPSAHGSFSLFAMLSALFYAATSYFGMNFRKSQLGISLVIILFALYLLVFRSVPDSRRTGVGADSHSIEWKIFRDGPILAVAGVVLLALLGDATLGNWSAIYVRKISHGNAVISSLAVAVYHGAMATGRFLVNRMLSRFSRLITLLLCGTFIAVGMLLGILIDQSAAALCSILVVGLSLAMVMPISISIGGDLRPDEPGDVSTVMILSAYVSNLIAPILIGSLADHFGFHAALSTVVAVGLGIAIGGTKIARLARRPQSHPAHVRFEA